MAIDVWLQNAGSHVTTASLLKDSAAPSCVPADQGALDAAVFSCLGKLQVCNVATSRH